MHVKQTQDILAENAENSDVKSFYAQLLGEIQAA
jgi:hypothetical protein